MVLAGFAVRFVQSFERQKNIGIGWLNIQKNLRNGRNGREKTIPNPNQLVLQLMVLGFFQFKRVGTFPWFCALALESKPKIKGPGSVAQWVERRCEVPGVRGSTPFGAILEDKFMVIVVQRLERQSVTLDTRVRLSSVTLIRNVAQVFIDRPLPFEAAGAWFVPVWQGR